MKKYGSWLVVLLWLVGVFVLSEQTATSSNQLSRQVTEVVVEKVIDAEAAELKVYNHQVRILAHFTLYLILALMVSRALRRRRGWVLLTLLMSGIFAGLDEFHQTFVDGRDAQLYDVAVDMAGACVGVVVYSILARVALYIKVIDGKMTPVSKE